MAVAIKLGGLCLTLGAVIVLLGEVVDGISGIDIGGSMGRYTEIMLKGLGISVLCRICSDVCRDCGENTVAAAVESAGRLTMVVLPLPLASELVEYAVELIEKNW